MWPYIACCYSRLLSQNSRRIGGSSSCADAVCRCMHALIEGETVISFLFVGCSCSYYFLEVCRGWWLLGSCQVEVSSGILILQQYFIRLPSITVQPSFSSPLPSRFIRLKLIEFVCFRLI